LQSAAAALAAEQREAEADQAVAAVIGRIPELSATWEQLQGFMQQMEMDIDSNNLGEWKAVNNRAGHTVIARCTQWCQQDGLTKGQHKIINSFDSKCRKAFF
jgi:hypothetical protein